MDSNSFFFFRGSSDHGLHIEVRYEFWGAWMFQEVSKWLVGGLYLKYTPCISRWNKPLILTIDPNFLEHPSGVVFHPPKKMCVWSDDSDEFTEYLFSNVSLGEWLWDRRKQRWQTHFPHPWDERYIFTHMNIWFLWDQLDPLEVNLYNRPMGAMWQILSDIVEAMLLWVNHGDVTNTPCRPCQRWVRESSKNVPTFQASPGSC